MGNKSVIISGAPESDIEYYKKYVNDRFVICADSGWEKCVKLNIIPDLIVGDFDSSSVPNIKCEKIILPVKKDDTDTFFAVKEAIKRDFTDVIILGAIGSRVDHTIANIFSLNYCYESGADAKIIDKYNRLSVYENKAVVNKDYKFFSFYPLFDLCKNVTVSGALYNIKNVDILPYEQFTQSNQVVDDFAKITFCGKILLIESND